MEPQNPNPNNPNQSTPIDPMQAIAGVPPMPTTTEPAPTTPAAPAEPATEPAAEPAPSAPSAAEQQMAAELEASRVAEEEEARIAAEKAAVEQANAAAAASQSKGKGMMIGLICAIVVAVAGIVFGVIMMLNGNSQADSLNKQIASLKQTNSSLQSQLEGETIVITTPDDEEETELTPVVAEDTADYIYVGEWGLKIALPENLKYVSYQFDERATETGQFLYVNGAVVANGTIPSFVNTSTSDYWLGCVSRYAVNDNNMPAGGYGTLIFSDGEYNYYVSGPQDVVSTDENDFELEMATVKTIKDMLSAPENYSAI